MATKPEPGDNVEELPEPLMVRFKTGYVPLGFISSLEANLVSANHDGSSDLVLLYPKPEQGENKTTFRARGKFDVTLISRAKYCEFRICRAPGASAEDEFSYHCPKIRKTLFKAVNRVISGFHKNKLLMPKLVYSLGFRCPTYNHSSILPGHKPLALSDSDLYDPTADVIPEELSCSDCNVSMSTLSKGMKVWYGEPFPPHILSQPASELKVGEGMDTTLTVSAQGPKPLTYQWARNGKNLQDSDYYGGSTTPNLCVTEAHSKLKGQYCCTVSNKGGSVTSDSVDLIIVRLQVISEEPSNKELPEGHNTTLSIKTQQGQILSYRWLKDGTILKEDDHYRGVATPCLSITNATPSHTGQYWCEVSNEGGSVSSTPSQLSVRPGMKFSIDMSCDQLCVWLEQKRVTGNDLQVFKDQNVDGDTFFTLPTDIESLEKKLKCTLTLRGSNKLCKLILQLHKGHTVEPPVITKHPLNKTAAEGKTVTFSIKAQGTNLKYEWWSNETILKEDDHYRNVSTPHLSISNAGVMHSGQYNCVVSNEGGRATSNHAQLVIKSQRLYEEAMKAGYVTVQIKNVLLFGMAGTGKTSILNLIFGLPPPEVRSSTPLAEAPKQVIRNISQSKVQAGDGKWEPVTVEKLEQLLADTIRSSAAELGDIPDELATKLKCLPENNISAANTLSTTTVDDTTAVEDLSDANFEMTIADIAGTVQDIVAKKVIDTSSGRHPREVLGSNWVYFTDSGGQPHFHNLLPLFIKGISAALYALRLCEGLDEHPMVEYYKDGVEVGTHYRAALTTLETFRNLVQSIHSRSEKESLRLVCIGTHFDKESECSEETLEQKNVKLLENLPQDISDITVRYRSKQRSDKLIFPVDAKNVVLDEQREQREKMAKELRVVIDECPSCEIKVPLWWYHFEIILEKIMREKGRKVLHKQECLQVAQQLRFHEDALAAALEFFHEQHIFHYYPTVLPDVVFCDTQVLLDKLTELVEYASFLRDGSSQAPVDGKLLRKLRDRGIITLEFLKGFSKHYVKGVFEPPELIQLFKELLILTPISGSLHCDFDSSSVTMEYFMPSLLDPLNESDLEKCRVFTAEAASLLFQFPNGWPRCGVFCCLQVYLVYHCKWELCLDESIPKQNMVVLRPPEIPSIVTLIDSFSCIELYVEALTNECESEYPSIRDNVLEGIKASCKALRYNQDPPAIAFFCPCDNEQPQTEVLSQTTSMHDPSAITSGQKHPVAVVSKKYMRCTKNSRKVYPLERKHEVWLVDVELFTESCYPPVKKLKIEVPQSSSEHAMTNPPMGHSPQTPYSQYPYGIPGTQYAGIGAYSQAGPEGFQPQFNPYGTHPGPNALFAATSASYYHPTNVVPGSCHGQPQLPGAPPWNITSAGPTSGPPPHGGRPSTAGPPSGPPPHGDRPSTVDGDISSATNSQSPLQQTSHHQGPGMKFSIDMSCDQLCVWLEQKRVTGNDLQVFKDQNVDGDTFSTLPNDSKGLEKKLKCTLTVGGSNKLCRLIQQLHKTSSSSSGPPGLTSSNQDTTNQPAHEVDYPDQGHTVEPPVITEHPLNKTTAEGKAVTVSIKAQGINLKYEWWSNETILKEDDHYSNVSTPHLSITNATIMHSGQYCCVISNEGGRATSNHAQLVITAKADRVRCLKICGCTSIAVLVATLAVIVGVCYGLPAYIEGGDVNTVVCSSQLKMKLTGTIIHPDGYPTLPTLLNFTLKTGETINIINMIAGNNFKQFGAHVLNDDQGVAVNIIAVRHRHDPVPIVTEIITNWLAGMGERPPTWRTLVKCLRTTTLHSLADRLEGQYDMTSHMGG